MKNDKETTIKMKLDFFLGKNIEVHVKRNDRKFWNGYIIEKPNNYVYVFKERKLGLVHLFVSDIYLIEEIKEVKYENNF